MGFGVRGLSLGFRVWSVWVFQAVWAVWGLGFCLGFGVWGLGNHGIPMLDLLEWGLLFKVVVAGLFKIL